ncbi:unnamed protein product [Oppiella nova]|uniref:Branched-chain-amino-acid transaminase n=1 Tax=Oppiella nova TaxID=334625 RepID=A0A7R9QT83_9ACAR|nr:unnamed protein product [Oppiella nova]CAG2173114.1 unnamed protein product [Oppiella nova]
MGYTRKVFNNINDTITELDSSFYLYMINILECMSTIVNIMVYIYIASVRKHSPELELILSIIYPAIKIVAHCMIHGMTQTSAQTFFKQLDKIDVVEMSEPQHRHYLSLKLQSVNTYMGFTIAGFIPYNRSTLLATPIGCPLRDGRSLYIRPTFIGTEAALGVESANDAILYVICGPVGPYFAAGAVQPVSLLADPGFVRAWSGGVGNKKVGANYGPAMALQGVAEKKGCQQVLWLYGSNISSQNRVSYRVTRVSLMELTESWGEFRVSERVITMAEVRRLVKEGRMLEMFGAGTACIVCPKGRIHFQGEDIVIPTPPNAGSLQMRLFKSLQDIQYGKVAHEWALVVD